MYRKKVPDSGVRNTALDSTRRYADVSAGSASPLSAPEGRGRSVNLLKPHHSFNMTRG